MISKQKFKQYIEFLKNYESKLEKANSALQNISTEFTGIYGIASPIIDQYMNMLTDLMGLTKVDSDLLWWWCYEQNFGKDTCEAWFQKKKYHLNTPEKLWDYITLLLEVPKSKKERKHEKKVS